MLDGGCAISAGVFRAAFSWTTAGGSSASRFSAGEAWRCTGRKATAASDFSALTDR
jgi:hypothetical protein